MSINITSEEKNELDLPLKDFNPYKVWIYNSHKGGCEAIVQDYEFIVDGSLDPWAESNSVNTLDIRLIFDPAIKKEQLAQLIKKLRDWISIESEIAGYNSLNITRDRENPQSGSDLDNLE